MRLITGLGGVAGRRRGHRPGRPDGRRVRRGPRRRHPRLPDDEPGLGRPVHEDRRARHRHRRHDLAPGRPRRASSASRPSSARPSRPHRIATGDRIRVDGTAGRVEILRGASRPRPADGARGRDRPLRRHDGRRRSTLRAASWPTRSRTGSSRASSSGHYPPDSRIVETQVARELGTSQAPVREALRGLEALGVVEITPVPRRPRPASVAARDHRGLRRPVDPRGARPPGWRFRG